MADEGEGRRTEQNRQTIKCPHCGNRIYADSRSELLEKYNDHVTAPEPDGHGKPRTAAGRRQ